MKKANKMKLKQSFFSQTNKSCAHLIMNDFAAFHRLSFLWRESARDDGASKYGWIMKTY